MVYMVQTMGDTEPQGSDSGPQGPDKASEPQGSTSSAGAPQGADQRDKLPETEGEWQGLARKWEKQAKADREALIGLRKQMQGLLTPEQVADKAAAVEAAAKEASQAKVEALRLRVALEKGIPANLADRLLGDDRASLEADADALAALIGKPKRAPDAAAGTGRPDNGTPAKRDPNDLLRVLAGH